MAIFQNQHGCNRIVTATITVHPEEFGETTRRPIVFQKNNQSMKNRFTALLVFCFPLFLAAQIDTTTFVWEHLPQPPVPVTSFARQGDRIFAGTNYGLFYSDDFGVSWQQHPDFLTKIEKVTADEQGVMVERYVLGQDYPPYSADRWYYIYRSGDGGNTFEPPIEVKAGWFHYGGYYSGRVTSINDSTLCYLDYSLGLLTGTGILHFTHDGGGNWDEYDFEIKGGFVSLFAALDTAVILRYANGKLVADRLPASDMSAAQTDSIYFPPGFDFQTGGFEQKLFTFRNNKYFAFTQNQFAVSEDFGQTWQVEPLPLPAGNKVFSFSDDRFYVRMAQGVFRSEVSAALSFTQVFSPQVFSSTYGINYSFARLGGLSITSNFGGLQLSFDDESTWETPLPGPSGSSGSAVLAGGYFWIGNWRFDPTVGQWELMTSPDLYGLPVLAIVNSPDDLLMGRRNNQMVFSPDGGDTWLNMANSPPGGILLQDGEDVFLLNNEMISRLDAGGTWVDKTVPGLNNFSNTTPQIIARQDSIFIFKKITSSSSSILRFKSFDGGDSWQVDTLSGWQFGQLFDYNGLLVSLPSYNNLLVSPDFGDSWTNLNPQMVIGPFWSGPTITVKGSIVAWTQDIFFANAEKGLRFTTDMGQHWTVVDQIPFSSTVNNLPAYNWTDEIPGAATYFIKDEYLYAFTQKHGILRAPLSGITGNPPPNFGDYGFIKGKVWKDKNPDCQFAPPDKPIFSKVVKAGNTYAHTNSNGQYSFWLPSGDYEVSTQPVLYSEILCDPLVQPGVQVVAGATAQADFALYPTPGIFDLRTTLTAMGPIRPGFQSTCKIRVDNLGNEDVAGASLVFYFNENDFAVVNYTPGGMLGNGQISFPLDLASEAGADFQIRLELSASVPIGTIETLTADASLPNDQTPANNVATLNREVTGSFDPNDKQVFAENNTTPAAANRLDYLIRFQNTGTDTAFRVVVLDTLDPRLDLLTLQMLDASHPYTLKIHDRGILQWTFDNILLPDSTTNEPGSHGFLRFAVSTFDSLLPDDFIGNRAGIYFDFNEPVITNTAEFNVPHFYVENEFALTLCAGETYGGVSYFEDATVIDTIHFDFYDSLLIANLTVLPSDTISVDLELCQNETSPLTGTLYDTPGTFTEQAIFQNQSGCDSTVIATLTIHPNELLVVDNGPLPYGTLYHGVVLTQDTQFVFFDTTEFGCLLTISENVTVEPSAVSDFEKTLNLTVFPNPTSGEFFVEMDLPQAMKMSIEVLDMLGRQVAVISENEFFQKGEQRIKIDAMDWPSGVYLLHFKTDGHAFSKKIMKN